MHTYWTQQEAEVKITKRKTYCRPNRVVVAPSAHKASNRVACDFTLETWKWERIYEKIVV